MIIRRQFGKSAANHVGGGNQTANNFFQKGLAFEKGINCDVDLDAALIMYQRASGLGHKEAKERIEVLNQNLNKVKIETYLTKSLDILQHATGIEDLKNCFNLLNKAKVLGSKDAEKILDSHIKMVYDKAKECINGDNIDIATACDLYRLCIEYGNQDAVNEYNTLSREIMQSSIKGVEYYRKSLQAKSKNDLVTEKEYLKAAALEGVDEAIRYFMGNRSSSSSGYTSYYVYSRFVAAVRYNLHHRSIEEWLRRDIIQNSKYLSLYESSKDNKEDEKFDSKLIHDIVENTFVKNLTNACQIFVKLSKLHKLYPSEIDEVANKIIKDINDGKYDFDILLSDEVLQSKILKCITETVVTQGAKPGQKVFCEVEFPESEEDKFLVNEVIECSMEYEEGKHRKKIYDDYQRIIQAKGFYFLYPILTKLYGYGYTYYAGSFSGWKHVELATKREIEDMLETAAAKGDEISRLLYRIQLNYYDSEGNYQKKEIRRLKKEYYIALKTEIICGNRAAWFRFVYMVRQAMWRISEGKSIQYEDIGL